MGVYIPNMEMPTSYEKCPFLDYEEGFCFASGVKGKSGWYEFTWCPSGIKDGRHKDCPLVPVPPHGRLGDLDRLEQMFVDIDNAPYSGFDGSEPFYSAEDAAQIIRLSPTIIPAEEGET